MCSNSYGQLIVAGKVESKSGENLFGATIIISNTINGEIVAYTSSNKDGEFKLELSDEDMDLQISTSFMGFKESLKQIEKTTKFHLIVLEESTEMLDEVLLELKPIEQKGDTINYDVTTFKDNDDRVIGDIIKKLPGIEILPGGKILYQGKPIQKYYIDNLDLLEGRYNLANENLSVSSVSKVQILENHQPIKILDSLVVSDRASLNIKLKNNITLSGIANVATGIPAPLFDVSLTPIMFLKNKQFLASYQYNNTGKDIAAQLANFYDSDKTKYSLRSNNLLSIIKPSTPPFDKNRWLDNQTNLATINGLVRSKKNLDIKFNFSYLSDNVNKVGATLTKFFTPNDTITILENISALESQNILDANIILEKNNKKTYFKNALQLQGVTVEQLGAVDINGVVNQSLSSPFQLFQNNFESYFTAGKQILSLNSLIGLNQTSQLLEISPTQFSDFYNEGFEVPPMNSQNLTYNNFIIENSVGLTKALKNGSYSSRLGFALSNERLTSSLGGLEDNDVDFTNETNFNKTKLFLDNEFNYTQNKWKFQATLPFAINWFQISGRQKETSQVTFEPQVLLSRKLTNYWSTSLQFNQNNTFGNIGSIYPNFILLNYRTLNRFDSPLLRQSAQSYSGNLNYRKAQIGLFANLNYSFNNSKSNLLALFNVGENGTVIREVIVQDNYNSNQGLSFGASKRIKKISTLLSVKASTGFSNVQQIINSELSDVNNNTLSFGLETETNWNKWLSTDYKATFSRFDGSVQGNSFGVINTQTHDVEVIIYFSQKQYIKLGSETYVNKSQSNAIENSFFNLRYQFSLNKKNIDFYIQWQNIFNEDTFVTFRNDSYISTERTFDMRPSQFLFGMKLSL